MANPWDEDGPGDGGAAGGAADAGPLRGLTWEALGQVAEAPSRLRGLAVSLAVRLAAADGCAEAVIASAKALKAGELAIAEAVSHLPGIFRLERRGHVVRLAVPGRDPEMRSPSGRAADAKAAEAAARARARDEAASARDDEDTPANAVRRVLEELGLCRADARTQSGRLVSQYGGPAARAAAEVARRERPASPVPYIMTVLKQRIMRAGGALPLRVFARAAPSGVRETVFVGWTSDRSKARSKLYRLPTGHLRSYPADEGEAPPSFEDDPGCEVAQ